MRLASRTRTDEILALAETLGDVKARADKVEADSGTYRAKATNSAGNAESNALTINVVVPVIAPKNVVASVVVTTPTQGANSGNKPRAPRD